MMTRTPPRARAALVLLLALGARAGIPLGPPKGLLSFEICGGLTNQRIALIEGLIIAQLTHRAVVLPALNPNGVQTGADYHEDRSRLAPFSTFYDVALTTERLARLGVKVAREWDAAWNATVPAAQRSALGAKDKMRRPDWYANLGARLSRQKVELLALDCAFLAVDLRHEPELRELYWRLDAALVFAPRVRGAADAIVQALVARGAPARAAPRTRTRSPAGGPSAVAPPSTSS